MVYCLLQPSLYFSQCWLIVNMNHRNIFQSNLQVESTIIIFITNAFQNTTRKMITISFRSQRIHSVRPGDAYICHWNDSSFVQLMGWHLFGYTLLAEIILTYCQLDTFEQISVEFGFKNERKSPYKKMNFKMSPANVQFAIVRWTTLLWMFKRFIEIQIIKFRMPSTQRNVREIPVQAKATEFCEGQWLDSQKLLWFVSLPHLTKFQLIYIFRAYFTFHIL